MRLKTKNGIKVRDLLSNPIYCTADEISFDYFYQKNGNICSDEKDFDAIHGIMAYNKTDQERLEEEESIFTEPNFVWVCADKPGFKCGCPKIRWKEKCGFKCIDINQKKIV